jgi:hypothetical protein
MTSFIRKILTYIGLYKEKNIHSPSEIVALDNIRNQFFKSDVEKIAAFYKGVTKRNVSKFMTAPTGFYWASLQRVNDDRYFVIRLCNEETKFMYSVFLLLNLDKYYDVQWISFEDRN